MELQRVELVAKTQGSRQLKTHTLVQERGAWCPGLLLSLDSPTMPTSNQLDLSSKWDQWPVPADLLSRMRHRPWSTKICKVTTWTLCTMAVKDLKWVGLCSPPISTLHLYLELQGRYQLRVSGLRIFSARLTSSEPTRTLKTMTTSHTTLRRKWQMRKPCQSKNKTMITWTLTTATWVSTCPLSFKKEEEIPHRNKSLKR